MNPFLVPYRINSGTRFHTRIVFMVAFIRCPAWVANAVARTFRLGPWRNADAVAALRVVKWLPGRLKTRMAYYNRRTGAIGVYHEWGKDRYLLAHELAHLIEVKHNDRHRRLARYALLRGVGPAYRQWRKDQP